MMKRKMKIKKMRSTPKKNKERINMNATIKFNILRQEVPFFYK